MGQLDLPISIRRRQPPGDVSDDVIGRLPSKLSALLLCVQVSGREEQEVCSALDLDPAQWTRIKQGKANFPTNSENTLMDFCGNEIPLRWQAWSRGKELKRRLSAVEEENEHLKEQLAELHRQQETIAEFMRRIGR